MPRWPIEEAIPPKAGVPLILLAVSMTVVNKVMRWYIRQLSSYQGEPLCNSGVEQNDLGMVI